MAAIIHLQVDPQFKQLVLENAENENRTLKGFITNAVKEYLSTKKQDTFEVDAEFEAIVKETEKKIKSGKYIYQIDPDSL